jgi:hypothetical protein
LRKMDVYIYGERRPLPEGFAAYHDRWRSAVVSRCCASGLARGSIGRRGGSKPARGAPAELILTRPEPKSGERQPIDRPPFCGGLAEAR